MKGSLLIIYKQPFYIKNRTVFSFILILHNILPEQFYTNIAQYFTGTKKNLFSNKYKFEFFFFSLFRFFFYFFKPFTTFLKLFKTFFFIFFIAQDYLHVIEI